jgi:hypothetical protein
MQQQARQSGPAASASAPGAGYRSRGGEATQPLLRSVNPALLSERPGARGNSLNALRRSHVGPQAHAPHAAPADLTYRYGGTKMAPRAIYRQQLSAPETTRTARSTARSSSNSASSPGGGGDAAASAVVPTATAVAAAASASRSLAASEQLSCTAQDARPASAAAASSAGRQLGAKPRPVSAALPSTSVQVRAGSGRRKRGAFGSG